METRYRGDVLVTGGEEPSVKATSGTKTSPVTWTGYQQRMFFTEVKVEILTSIPNKYKNIIILSYDNML